MAKLLVADDLVPIRQMVRITLSTQGWTIVEAKNGNEALALTRSEKPDLVLLDVDMGPGPNGFDVCRQIKADEATKDIPVVMLTAHESDSDRAIGFAAGANPIARSLSLSCAVSMTTGMSLVASSALI